MALWQLMHVGTMYVTWAHDIRAPGHMNRTSCASVHELPQSYCGDDREGALFSWLRVYYTHLASVRCVSWITYDHLWSFIYIYIYIYIYIILSRINKTTMNILLKVSRFFDNLQVNVLLTKIFPSCRHPAPKWFNKIKTKTSSD